MRPVFSYQEMLAYLNQAAPFDAQYLKKQDIHHQFDSKREITMQEIRSLEREQDIDTFVRKEEKELLECFFINGFLEAPEPTEEEVEYITQLLSGTIPENCSFKEPTEHEVEEVIQIFQNPNQIQRYDREEMNLLSCAWKMAHITREEYDRWRYRYPEFDTSGQWHKISPSQGLSDGIVKRGRKRMKRIMKEN